MKPLRLQIALGWLLLLCVTTPHSGAQSDSIDWYKVAAGAGTSSGGVYSVSGIIGQPDAGIAMSGGSYALNGGFWSLASTIRTTGSPTLSITYFEGNAIVSWLAQSGWGLQQNPQINNPAGWTNSPVATTNGVSFHNVNNASGTLFFRLKHN